MSIYDIIGFCIDALLLILFVVVIIKNKNLNNSNKLTFDKNDIMLKKNTKYLVDKDKIVKQGVYVLTSPYNKDNFNIRINGIARQFDNHQSIAFADGDQIEAVSGNVILKKEK